VTVTLRLISRDGRFISQSLERGLSLEEGINRYFPGYNVWDTELEPGQFYPRMFRAGPIDPQRKFYRDAEVSAGTSAAGPKR